jgi:hypothetical protein
MGLHFYVKFGEDAQYTDITEYIKYDSVKFDIQLMSKSFKSVQDSVSARTIYDQTINNKFFTASTWMPAYITYDLQEEQMYGYPTDNVYGDEEDAYGFLSPGRIFTGAVFPITKDQYKSYPDEGVSFEIVDNSYLLEVDCEQFMYTSAYDVFNPADTTYSVIHQLLYSVGFTDTDISADVMIQKSIGFIAYEDKDKTIDDILNELLYEYHHVFYFNEDGQFRLYDWGHDVITVAGTITDDLIKDDKGIERERNTYEFDGYKVLFKNLIEKSNTLVYREDVDEEGSLLLSGQAFPADGEFNTVKQEFSTEWLSDDAELLATSNHQLDLTADDGIVALTENYENLEAQIVIKNMNAESKRWYQLDVRADVTYTDKSNDITIPATAQILDDDIQLEHIYDVAEATAFANALYSNSIEYGLHVYAFNSETLFNVGTCYTLEHYSNNVLITAKKFNYYEHIYEYECISVGAQVSVTPDIIYRNSSSIAADKPSKQLALEVDFNSIDISARGALLVEEITFKARTLNIPVSTLVWNRSDGGALTVVSGNDYLRTLDTSTVAGEWVTVTVSSTYGGANYTASYTVKKVYQNPVPKNFEGVDVVPEDVDGEPLISGDYFLWTGDDTPADPPIPALTRGEIYEYTGSEWIKSADGNKVMTLFDSFADLANDVDSTVIGNAVIKKLVAIEAFIQNLKAENLSVGTGDGTFGSGFRFRAMQDQYMSGSENIVWDIMYGDKVVFKVEPTSGKVYFGSQFWYDPADGAIHSTNDKTVIDSSGSLKATFAEIIGTIRTGPNAPTNTRLGARDQSGITVGPTFSGSGLNDLSIATEGTVDMLGIVKIESVNHRDTSVTVPLTSASDWTIRSDTYDFANKCFDNATNRILGAGNNALGYSADSGNTWVRTNSTGIYWKDIAYSPATGIAVAVGSYISSGYYYGRIAYSTNHGTSWTIISLSGTYVLESIAVNSSGRFVTACSGAYGDEGIYYSDNGSSWTRAYSTSYAVSLQSTRHSITCNSSGRFVVLGYGYSGGRRDIFYSDNGSSWYLSNIECPSGDSTLSYYPSSNRFIMSLIYFSGSVPIGLNFYYSTNGTSWTFFKSYTGTGSTGVVDTFSGFAVNTLTGYMVAGGKNYSGNKGYIYYSANGSTINLFQLSTYKWDGKPVADLHTGRFIVSQQGSNIIAHTDVKPYYDKVRWSGNNGSTWTTGVSIPENKLVSLTAYGVVVSFGSRAGHTVNDQWSFTQEEMHGLVIWDLFGNEYLKATDGLLKIRDKIELGTPSISANGYSLLPNGLILQWGYVGTGSAAPTVNFPMSFPNACLNVQATIYNVDVSTYAIQIRNLGKTSFILDKISTDRQAQWMAIGY